MGDVNSCQLLRLLQANLDFLFVFGFYYNNLTLENGGCELVSTVTFVLQANLPNKFPRDTEFVV